MLISRKSFGEFISKRREHAGLSQQTLASKLGYNSGQFVSNWERGTSFPPLDKLPKLAALLKIPIEELIDIITAETREFLEGELLTRPKRAKLKRISSN